MNLTQFFSQKSSVWVTLDFNLCQVVKICPQKRKRKKCWHLHFFWGQSCDVAKVVIIQKNI
jgi:hypothetical protein